ncbi:hypothetical protein [Belnapia rosea]|uniref:hypothetical protein n=1 Tax=Belnapia rosea TaxID=938405 RepID=UPI0008820638|nr:hypothetical protein [Belnapia rosea]SDB74932.1 hypothetical protein SAMN02927895_05635 [Belnapia rosea]
MANHLSGFLNVGIGFALALALGGVGPTYAQSTGTQDPSVGGQNNRCWGEAASQTAKLGDPSVTGGGMGAHSRSATAADINGGFASNGFITQPRNGVGNQSRIPEAPHQTEPGDGGNGQHAVNNIFLTQFINPVTGEFNGELTLTPCSTGMQINLPPP